MEITVTIRWNGGYVIIFNQYAVWGYDYTIASEMVKTLEAHYGLPVLGGFAGGCHYTFDTRTISQLRAAWQRDWDKLIEANTTTSGTVRHLYNDRPEDVDPQIFESWVRKDYENSRVFYGLRALETDSIV